jgi:hypothetical protein
LRLRRGLGEVWARFRQNVVAIEVECDDDRGDF